MNDIETWKRQAAVGLVTGHMLLEDMEAWVKRT